MSAPRVAVVGIGADGWAGLGAAARDVLLGADVVLGGERHLDLLPTEVGARRVAWPSPLLPALPGLLGAHVGRRLVVLASGDPMFFGIGTTLMRLLGAASVDVLPHPSSVSLACARLGWALEDVEVVSAVGRPLATVHPAVQPGRRVLVLVGSSGGAREVCDLLVARGYPSSAVTLLSQLGGASESVVRGTAGAWDGDAHDRLAIVAVDCVASPEVVPLPRTPGLPDDAFAHEGQITKREVRALALAMLAPVPGQLLWDVGAGSGSIGIEWMRVHPSCRAVAIEPRADRRSLIEHNASALGVPGLLVVDGSAPDALDGLPAPDAVFVGGGVSVPGVLDACVAALPVGGRLVANGVTIETESVLASWHARLGGSLTRIGVERASPLGGFTGWRPAMPVTQWSYRKDEQ